MKKTILLVILDQYADWEAAYLSSAVQVIGKGNYEVKTVSLTKDPVCSIGGFRVIPNYDIYSIPEDYEALILIGGMSWRNENALGIKPLAEKCRREKKILGGICDSSAFLGAIGLLNDVYHTSNDINDLKQWAGKAYSGEEKYLPRQAVSCDNLITANGTAPLEFAKEILLALNIAPADKISDWYLWCKLGLYNAPMPEF